MSFHMGEFSRICCLFFFHIQFPANPIVTQKRHSQQTSNKGHFCTIAPYIVVGGMSSVYIEIGGIHPTPCRPKPLPTTPHNSDVMIKLLSQKEEVWSESLCPFKKVKVF